MGSGAEISLADVAVDWFPGNVDDVDADWPGAKEWEVAP